METRMKIGYFECNNWNPSPEEAERLIYNFLYPDDVDIDPNKWVFDNKLCINIDIYDMSINYWITAPYDWFSSNFPEVLQYVIPDENPDPNYFLEYKEENFGIHSISHLLWPLELVDEFKDLNSGYIKMTELLGIINNTKVCDACGNEEKLSMNWYLEKIIKDGPDCIKDGRLVIDKTFAIRLYNFLKDIKEEDEEEMKTIKKYTNFAKNLFNLQLQTVTDINEIIYLKNIGYINDDGIKTPLKS